jgi:Fur family iron response transcriptional regulator
VDPERQFYDSTTYDHHHLYNVDTGELIDVDHADILVTYSFDMPDGTQHLGTEVILKTKTQES